MSSLSNKYYGEKSGFPCCTAAAAAAKLLQSCPTLCDPIDCSPPGFPVPGILQARTLEWVAISFSNAWKWKVEVKSLSRVQPLVTPWTAAFQAPLSMGFIRQEYWPNGCLKSSTFYQHTFFGWIDRLPVNWQVASKYGIGTRGVGSVEDSSWSILLTEGMVFNINS